MDKNNSIHEALETYTQLKKSNFTDVHISKIAQILLACSINERVETVNPATGEVTYQ